MDTLVSNHDWLTAKDHPKTQRDQAPADDSEHDPNPVGLTQPGILLALRIIASGIGNPLGQGKGPCDEQEYYCIHGQDHRMRTFHSDHLE